VLSSEQLVRFARCGYVVVRGVVSEDLLSAADAEIDRVIERDAPPRDRVGHHFYFRNASQLPAADAALRRSAALALAERLVEPARLDHAFDQIQIALNIPPYPHRPGGPHLDGHRPDQDRPDSFTMLGAIFLVDESAPDSGNLWVWPGSHLVHQLMFAERGPRILLGVSGHTLTLDDPPELPDPHPVLAQRGDLLLAHYLLGHNIGGNVSGRTRRILYYRLSCSGHDERWEDTFLDALTEYPSLHAIVRQRGG
jgi:ectoine hydroxylase-related dioxygenase (phytanoyl-CoA dioxygenase family)